MDYCTECWMRDETRIEANKNYKGIPLCNKCNESFKN